MILGFRGATVATQRDRDPTTQRAVVRGDGTFVGIRRELRERERGDRESSRSEVVTQRPVGDVQQRRARVLHSVGVGAGDWDACEVVSSISATTPSVLASGAVTADSRGDGAGLGVERK